MHLAEDIHIARIDRRAVVLDLARDRYLGLGANLTAGLFSSIEPRGEDDARALAITAAREALMRRGILTNRPRREPATAPSIGRAVESLWPAGSATFPPRGRWAASADVLASLWRVSRALDRGEIARTLSWLRREKVARLARATPGACASASDSLDLFGTTRPWFPQVSICRLDAPALCLTFWRAGISAALVFGVRLDPFAAHCWVQIDDRVANEPYDSIFQYTPILAI